MPCDPHACESFRAATETDVLAGVDGFPYLIEEHFHDAHRAACANSGWVIGLQAEGLQPAIHLLCLDRPIQVEIRVGRTNEITDAIFSCSDDGICRGEDCQVDTAGQFLWLGKLLPFLLRPRGAVRPGNRGRRPVADGIHDDLRKSRELRVLQVQVRAEQFLDEYDLVDAYLLGSQELGRDGGRIRAAGAVTFLAGGLREPVPHTALEER
ncbi:hypothetical protein ACFU51_37760 [Streptomyces sp. NPDC057430]|uniref:hypothetical protein n=1 Tax=Streptomyces sp. NPDC057430 TaxID=3346131 RepID=UPI003696AF67